MDIRLKVLDNSRVSDSIKQTFHVLNKIANKHGDDYATNAMINSIVHWAFCQPEPDGAIRAIHVSIDALARQRGKHG